MRLLHVPQWRPHLRPAIEAALIAWVAILIIDWQENVYTRPKGTGYAVGFLFSLPSLVLGIGLAIVARDRLVRDVQARSGPDGALPPPHRVMLLGIKRGLMFVWLNLPGYMNVPGRLWHAALALAMFAVAGAVGGVWLARSVIARNYPEPVSRPYAASVAVLPGFMLAALATSTVLVVTRMGLDDAIGWAFQPVTCCGGVEVANATLHLLPTTLVFVGTVALTHLGGRRLLGARGESRRGRALLAVAFVGIASVSFAELGGRFLASAPPRSCFNTPHQTPVDAILYLRSPAFLRGVLWSSGAVGGALGALVVVVAARRRPPAGAGARAETGPYRSARVSSD